MRRTVLIPLLALVAALAIVAAGCGGGGSEKADDTTTVATETTAPEETTETTEETTEETTSDDDDDVTNVASADDCRELVELGSKLAQALGGSGGDDVERTKEFLNEFADRAPEEVREDFKVLAEAYAKIIDAIGDLDLKPGETPSPEVILKLQQIGSEVDQEKLQEASENIQRWSEENCN